MLFVGTSIIHPSTEGVFLLCNILDLLIYSYKMTNVEDVTGDDLNDLKSNYEDINVKVSAAKTVEVEFTLKGDETEISNSLEVSVIKVDRSWYLDLYTMGNLF